MPTQLSLVLKHLPIYFLIVYSLSGSLWGVGALWNSRHGFYRCHIWSTQGQNWKCQCMRVLSICWGHQQSEVLFQCKGNQVVHILRRATAMVKLLPRIGWIQNFKPSHGHGTSMAYDSPEKVEGPGNRTPKDKESTGKERIAPRRGTKGNKRAMKEKEEVGRWEKTGRKLSGGKSRRKRVVPWRNQGKRFAYPR